MGVRRHRQDTAVAAVAAPFGRDVERSLRQIERAVTAARGRGARLVVFPESAIGGYLYEPVAPSPHVTPLVVPPSFRRDDHELIGRLAALAGDAVVCVGYTEIDGAERYSSALCVSGDGVLGHHRKVHIPAGERASFSAGDGFRAFDTPVGRVGMLLCYDKMFPDAATTLAQQGATTIVSMAAWPVCRLRPSLRMSRDRQVRHFNLLDQTRAVENQVLWVSTNQTGRLGRLRFPGQAKVVCPDGRILARTGTRGGTALARLDIAGTVGRLRDEISHLDDRVEHTYGVAGPGPRRAVA